MVKRNFKIGALDASNVNVTANGFSTTLTANVDLSANVSFSLPGADGSSGQVLSTDGSGNLFFADSSADTQAYVGDTLVSNTALILEAGSGVSISANANSGVISFSTSMSNVTSQTIAVDGSANTFTLAKSVSNSHMVIVSYNGLLQGPEEYSVADTTLTISNSKPLLADSKIEVRYFDFFELPGVSAGGAQEQDSVNGYTSGGYVPPAVNTIDKFPFAVDANATDVGDLTSSRRLPAGQSSEVSGYTSGSFPATNIIDKFPFSTDSNATDVGDLTVARGQIAGQSSSTSGYSSGGATPITVDIIDKFPFSSDGNATDVGDLTQARRMVAGQSSSISGYTSGGFNPSGQTNVIDKFPFSSDGNATDVGDLTQSRNGPAGQSSSSSGYTSGGFAPPTVNTIDKFPFSSDANATDVGDLTQIRSFVAGQSSTTSGYTSGDSNIIDKFPFATDANATDVGDLTQARNGVAGQQG